MLVSMQIFMHFSTVWIADNWNEYESGQKRSTIFDLQFVIYSTFRRFYLYPHEASYDMSHILFIINKAVKKFIALLFLRRKFQMNQFEGWWSMICMIVNKNVAKQQTQNIWIRLIYKTICLLFLKNLFFFQNKIEQSL